MTTNLAVLTNVKWWCLAKDKRERSRQKGRRNGWEEKIDMTGVWNLLSEGLCKVELKFTVVTLTFTEALCVIESCKRDRQRKLLSFDIQIIFKYSNKKLVLSRPSGFLSTTMSILPSPLFLPLSVCCVSPPPLSVFQHCLISRQMQLEGHFDSHRQRLVQFWCIQQQGQETMHFVSLSLFPCLCSQFFFSRPSFYFQFSSMQFTMLLPWMLQLNKIKINYSSQ